MYNISGIQTKGPRDINFSSRLEAQWAYIFDDLKLSWKYEPYDLNDCIPNFIINVGNIQILVEVRGDNLIWHNHDKYIDKIINSGWQGYYIFLCGKYCRAFNNINIGIGGIILHGKVIKKSNIILYNNYGWHIDLVSGRNTDTVSESYYLFNKIWSNAKNKVQWRPKNKIVNSEQNIKDKHSNKNTSYKNKLYNLLCCKDTEEGYVLIS